MSHDDSAKNRQHETWTSVADGWRRHDDRLRASMAAVSELMLDVSCVGLGHRVLDIASGTGEPAIPAAQRVGPTGRVVGTDFVEQMLVVAREKAAMLGLDNLELRQVDCEALDVPPSSFDAVLCRWGIMFMPDPALCLRRAYEALKPGGRCAVACWAAPGKNPWASLPLEIVRRHIPDAPAPPAGAPGIFAFADPDRLAAEMASAGFSDVQIDQVPVLCGGKFEDGAAFVRFILDLAGPIADLFGKFSPKLQTHVFDEVVAEVEARQAGAGVVMPGLTWVAHGQKLG
ncbi:MAG: methyltransferase domain-containing protein [Deltaproteobacteria bacterium]|nr:methyltransferase domain-containing protein [Deltaproteobacteria bacterium]